VVLKHEEEEVQYNIPTVEFAKSAIQNQCGSGSETMALPIEMERVPGEPVEEKEDIPGSGHSVTDPRT
jgi:hypothetical protein